MSRNWHSRQHSASIGKRGWSDRRKFCLIQKGAPGKGGPQENIERSEVFQGPSLTKTLNILLSKKEHLINY